MNLYQVKTENSVNQKEDKTIVAESLSSVIRIMGTTWSSLTVTDIICVFKNISYVQQENKE